MLASLRVENYALIEHLELELASGFTVITGETGAGKSILLGALGHLLGRRADLKVLRHPERKCIIEGHFVLEASRFQPLFEKLDLDFEEPCIIRREITPSGKSRAFVNDSPLRLDSLNILAERLIDVHSQHQNLLLNDYQFQLDLLDDFAQNIKEREAYALAWKALQDWRKKGQELEASQREQGGDRDYLQFLFEELASAKVEPGEQSLIESQLEKAENAEQIASALADALHKVEGLPEQEGALNALQSAHHALAAIARFSPSYRELENRLKSSLIELEDLRSELEGLASDGDFDPQAKETLDQRLSLLVNLQKKHQVGSADALIERQNEIEKQLLDRESIDREWEAWQKIGPELHQEVEHAAASLSASRKKPIAKLEKAIASLLQRLNMAQARMAIELEPNQDLSAHGSDRIRFLFSANPGQPLAPVNKVASGGELSRVMLAIKAIMAQTRSLPTIILDEIDSGVSGETARRLGEIMNEMGEHMQVVAITHLPQIASLGAQHFKVSKEITNQQTTTQLYKLSASQRLEEVARLLSGDEPSHAALENARSLMSQAKT